MFDRQLKSDVGDLLLHRFAFAYVAEAGGFDLKSYLETRLVAVDALIPRDADFDPVRVLASQAETLFDSLKAAVEEGDPLTAFSHSAALASTGLEIAARLGGVPNLIEALKGDLTATLNDLRIAAEELSETDDLDAAGLAEDGPGEDEVLAAIDGGREFDGEAAFENALAAAEKRPSSKVVAAAKRVSARAVAAMGGGEPDELNDDAPGDDAPTAA